MYACGLCFGTGGSSRAQLRFMEIYVIKRV